MSNLHDPGAMTDTDAAVCILAHGHPAYWRAALETVCSVLRRSRFDVWLYTDSGEAFPWLRHPRLRVRECPKIPMKTDADPFMLKFAVWNDLLSQTRANHLLLLDADTVLVAPMSVDDIQQVMGGAQLGMTEQTAERGTSLDRRQYFDHFTRVSLAAVEPDAESALERFRYMNSGVMMVTRAELSRITSWVTPDRLRSIADRAGPTMVSDQDVLQVWAHVHAVDRTCCLPSAWNHCPIWDEDFPRAEARILHFSNWLRGPDENNLAWMQLLAQRYALNRPAARQVWRASPHAADAERARFGVVSVTYQSSAHIAACVEAALSRPGFACTVIDNASTDDSVERALQSGATVVSNPSNSGFAAAANRGAHHSVAPFIVFLNPDCVLTSEAAATIEHAAAEDPAACWVPDYEQDGATLKGVQSGYTRLKLLTDIIETAGAPSRWIRLLRRLPGHDAPHHPWPLAACMLIGRAQFAKTGGFDEHYFLYMEDVEMGSQLQRAGIPLRSLPARIPHGGCEGAQIPLSARFNSLTNARLRYARRHYGRGFALFLKGLRAGFERYAGKEAG